MAGQSGVPAMMSGMQLRTLKKRSSRGKDNHKNRDRCRIDRQGHAGGRHCPIRDLYQTFPA
jgi:hypothetical protein